MAAGSGPNTRFTDAEQVALAEQALARQDWPAARELWHQLACAHPQSRPYRAQLTFARAGECWPLARRSVRARSSTGSSGS